jgi:hypothetical protein
VENHFAQHGNGKITEIKLMNGFGFIEYEDEMDARDVVPGMLLFIASLGSILLISLRSLSYVPLGSQWPSLTLLADYLHQMVPTSWASVSWFNLPAVPAATNPSPTRSVRRHDLVEWHSA